MSVKKFTCCFWGLWKLARRGIRRKLHFLFFTGSHGREIRSDQHVVQPPGFSIISSSGKDICSAVQIKLAIAQHGFGNELFLQALIAWSLSCDFSRGPHGGRIRHTPEAPILKFSADPDPSNRIRYCTASSISRTNSAMVLRRNVTSSSGARYPAHWLEPHLRLSRELCIDR